MPEGTARLRVTLSAAHSQAQVDALLATLEEVLQEGVVQDDVIWRKTLFADVTDQVFTALRDFI